MVSSRVSFLGDKVLDFKRVNDTFIFVASLEFIKLSSGLTKAITEFDFLIGKEFHDSTTVFVSHRTL